MNKNFSIAIIVGVIILIIGGGLFFINYQNKNSTDSMTASDHMTGSDQTGKDSMMKDQNSRYVEFLGNSTLDNYSDKKRVLFFYANWCPICRPADADFKKNAESFPENLVLIRVNYNDSDTDEEEKGLADKYGITYQHTFVQIDENGNEITRWSSGQTKELLANIK